MNQSILVVDDDRSIVKVVQSYLEQVHYRVFVAYDGETALHLLRSERPDLLILDLMLPDRDGWSLTRLIRNDPSLSATPIIMLTARIEESDKVIGLELGADDYVTKPFQARELVARVRSLLRRAYLAQNPQMALPQRLQVGQLVLDIDQHQLTVAGQSIALTPTEFKLLHLLMANPGHTLARDELLEKVMGYAYEGMGRALDTHIRNLRKKIEPTPDAPTYIETVYGIGYRFVGE